MKHLALYRKWRPQRFAEVVGQDHISRTLLNAIRQDRLAHAYLFCGPRGTGKTTSARLLAKALNCTQRTEGEPCNQCDNCQDITAGHSLDVIEIDAASNRGIDSARDLREQVRFASSSGRYRVFIIDEFHMLTKDAFNALLKTLEEPPENVVFVLATTEPHEVLPTIISRCQRFDFQRITPAHLKTHLHYVAQAEQIGISESAIEAIARKANGGLRDALSLLDQVQAIAMPGETLSDTLIYQTLGLVEEDVLLELTRSLFDRDLSTLMQTLRHLLEQGHDPLQIVEELIQLLRHLSLSSLPSEQLLQLGVPSHLIGSVQSLGKTLSRGDIVSAIDLLLRTGDRLHHCSQPDIWLEADLICLCLQAQPALLQRVEQLEAQMQGAVPQRTRPAKPLPDLKVVPQQPTVAQISLSPITVSDPVSPLTPPEPTPQDTHVPEPLTVTMATQLDHSPLISPSSPLDPHDIEGLWRAFLQEVKSHHKPLIGFLLNGRLAEVDTLRKAWIIEFRSKPHHERIKAKLKEGHLQTLLEPIMGTSYTIETRLNTELEKKNEPVTPPVSRPPETRPAAAPLAAAPPEFGADIDYLPEEPHPEEPHEISPPADFASSTEKSNAEVKVILNTAPIEKSALEEAPLQQGPHLQEIADLFKGKIL